MEGACAACLTVGRRLHSLGTDMLLFQTLLSVDSQEYHQGGGPVCWECKALLLRVRSFRTRARQASQFLRNAQMNGVLVFSHKHTLSTLGNCLKTFYDHKLKFDEPKGELHTPSVSPTFDYDEPLDCKPEEKYFVKSEPAEPADETAKPRKRKSGPKRKLKKSEKRRESPKQYERKTNIKTKKDMCARFKTLKMSEADMLRGREEDRNKPFYVKAVYKCESCLYGYYREKPYLEHVAEKHSETSGLHECAVCASRFPRANLLQSHARRHYRRYRCRACGFQHRDVKHMLRHYETQHETDKSFPCSDCGRLFPRYYALRYHKESCHRESTECEHCGKVLSSRTNYRRHLMLHTGMPERECPVCRKVFRGDELFKSHMRVHRTEPAPDAYCAECDLHFKHLYIYKSHLKNSLKHITPDQLKWPCSLCDKKFRQQNHLTRHFDSVHLKKTKFVCPHCDKNMCTKGALRTHVRTVHERVPVKKDKVCDICARSFATKATLQNHIRTHTGERPFHCNICSATFGHSSALWTHNKLVHLKLKKSDRVTAGVSANRPYSADTSNVNM